MFTTVLGVAIYVGSGWAETPVVWHKDYAMAHAEACTQDKPLFIVICQGSSEYGRMISLGLLLSDQIESSLQSNYVRLVVDTETPEGAAMAAQFEAGTDPHFVVIDRSGRWQVYYQSGYLLENELAPVLAQFRRSKLGSDGRPIRDVARVKRPAVQVCST